MTTPETQAHEPNPGQITSLRVLFARLLWVMLGPIVLLLVTMGIVSGGAGWTTGLDLIFAVVVCLMIAGRWVELKSGEGAKLTGEAETTDDFRKYAFITLPTTGILWIAANVLGNHVLN